MRVISGSAKGRRLQRVPGDTTRPIMDRVKESLFDILGEEVAGGRWLDLFAGTGQVGIEALSRGAAAVVFVDKVAAAVRTVRANLRTTGLEAGASVVRQDAFAYLRRGPSQPFDLIYVAPPQYQGMWHRVLAIIDEKPASLLAEEGLVVVQIDPREYQEMAWAHLALVDQRRYGNTLLCFYRRAAPATPPR